MFEAEKNEDGSIVRLIVLFSLMSVLLLWADILICKDAILAIRPLVVGKCVIALPTISAHSWHLDFALLTVIFLALLVVTISFLMELI